MNKKHILLFILACLIAVIIVKMVKGFIPMPIGIRHFYHLITTPDDLYDPIVTDNFLFHEKGFTKTYFLAPKYLDIYDIGILSVNKNLSSKYKFRGQLLVVFLYRGKQIFQKISDSIDTAWYVEGDMTKFKKINLMRFEIPILGKYKDDISLKISVIESDQTLKEHGDSIMLYVAVSAIP